MAIPNRHTPLCPLKQSAALARALVPEHHYRGAIPSFAARLLGCCPFGEWSLPLPPTVVGTVVAEQVYFWGKDGLQYVQPTEDSLPLDTITPTNLCINKMCVS